MSKKRNSSAVGSIIAAICIVIYLFAVVQAGIRIFFSIEQRRNTAEVEFSNIAAIALTSGTQGFMDDQFKDAMNKALAANRSIEALIISGLDSEFAFERQQGYAIMWVNDSPRFKTKFNFSKQDYYKPLQINDLRNANIRAIAGTFDFDEIAGILKDTLLLILIGFAVAFFTMLLQFLVGKSDEKPVAIKLPVPGQYSIKKAPEQPEPRPELEPSLKPENKTPEKTEAPVLNNSAPEEAEPKGLYSPRSNIGWEEYIKDRLDSELHRCSSTERDLTIILMAFTDTTSDLMYKLAAEEAISFFSSRDLLFEYGKLGIAAILPGFDLDTGISKSEKYFKHILQKFSDSKKIQSSLCIGLSSRSGRLINADRLVLEAQEALSKAKQDQTSPIIAFKSDPEKYRAFIASQNSARL
jgi:GGDEF domain-containing protein